MAIFAAGAVHAECQLTRVATLLMAAEQRPTIEVRVNGARLLFVIDTGAELSAVTPETVIALNLPRDRERGTNLTTIDGAQKAPNVLLANLEIADQKYADRSFAVQALGRLDASRPLAGLLGADLLVDFDIEIDPPGRTLNLYHSFGCQAAQPPWQGRYQTIQMVTTERGRLLIPVEVDGHALTAMLDTGADVATLSRAAAGRLDVTDDVLARDPSSFGGSGGHGQVRFWRHRFHRMKIGAETFYDPVLTVGDFDVANADMLLGARYAKTRRLFISYSTNELFIQSEQTLVALQNAVLPQPGHPPGPTSAASSAPTQAGQSDPCRAEPETRARLAKAPLTVLSRPGPAASPPTVSGCASAIFQIGADGSGTGVELLKENPPGQGLGDRLKRQIVASRFSSPAAPGAWFYAEAHYHPRQAPDPAAKATPAWLAAGSQ